MVDDEASLNRGEERKVSKSDPQWVGKMRDKFQAFRILTEQGQNRLLWNPHDVRRNSVLETEYDLRIQNEAFNLVDQTRDKLPAFISLTSKEDDLTQHLGVNLSLRRGIYFITATHERYIIYDVGQKDRRFDPESSEFIGIDQIRKMKPTSIISPRTDNLRKGEAEEQVALLISGVGRYLSKEDREIYVDPVEQKIKVLEEEKSLQIQQSIKECSLLLQEQIGKILQLIPENYKGNLPLYFDLGQTYKDWDGRDGGYRILFLLSSGELVISPNTGGISSSDNVNKWLKELVMSRMESNKDLGLVGKLLKSFRGVPKDWKGAPIKDWRLEDASDTDWLLYGGSILTELVSYLSENYGERLS